MELFALKQKPEYLDQVAEWLYLEWGIKTAGSSRATVCEKLETFNNIDKIPINYVALNGEKLVGTFNLMLFDPPTRRDLSPWLGSLYVEPTYRNRGIGTFLVNAAVAKAKNFKIKKLYLCTSTQEKMYAKLGWEVIDEVDFRDERVLIMEIST
ncbi:MAG: GNAT family N-acetyltransferase [Proteobacteria bacterium]|nr:GNAT family N-acetyltransferase [Pseudomonadota bacterium]MBU1419625.1 GNAT family N-acetyltransferase [Pseudomonadota bacterium]MBU1453417.1 GNAT family N-acetyltransferase [Pseudomonadota bacterium]